MKLAELKVGESAEVRDVAGKGALRRRLFDMGITPGTYELTLRAHEAESVEVEKI